MTNLNDLLFDVKMVDFQEQFGIPANSDYKNAIIGTIDGQEKLLNACSDYYELIPNSQIFPQINQNLNNANINYSASYKSINDARFYADYIIEDRAIQISKGDVIKPRIQIRHSYNGLTKYSIVFGYFRLICTNGLVIPVESENKFNLNITGKHTKSINESFDKLLINLNIFTNEAQNIAKTFKVLAEKKVLNPEERLTEVMNQANIKKGQDLILNTIRKESAQLYGGTVNDWLIYNGINEYINNDQNNKKAPEAREAIDQKVLSFIMAS